MDRLFRIVVLIAGVGIAAIAAPADSASLNAVRFGGVSYVAINDLAKHYGLGRNLSNASDEARYRSSLGNLAFTSERRNIELDGIAHWLSVPVLEERGRLWISSLDALKVIDPVLRGARSREPSKVRTIVLDPGHGGTDRGARGVSALEKEMTLDVARRVERLLKAEGIRVVLSRTKDVAMSLDERVQFSRNQRADLFISIHFNAAGATAEGIETFCLPPAGAPSTATPFRQLSSASESLMGNRYDDKNVWLAHCIQKALIQQTAASDRGVRRARFQVLRDISCPAVLVECGFLSNRNEERKIISASYREQLAKAICEGVLRYRKTVE